MKSIFMASLTCALFLFAASSAFPSEPEWTVALGGEVEAGPLLHENRIYAAGSDRMVTCLSESGAFLWRKSLPGKTAPFLRVTGNGTVYAVTEPGTITALNADGSLLWHLRGKKLPLFAPYEGRDGRFFLIYQEKIVCVSHTGAVKWTLPLDSTPVFQPSQTGDGDILLACDKGLLLRISPFGALLEKTQSPEIITALIPLPSGYAAGYRTGLVQSFDVRNERKGENRTDTELLWQFSSPSSCISLVTGKGTLLSIHADGTLHGLNITDGTPLWNGAMGTSIKGPVFAEWDYDQFNLAFQGRGCAFTATGDLVWAFPLPENLHALVISPSGNIFASAPDWVLYGYRAESRIITEKKAQKPQNYGILNAKSSWYSLAFASDPMEIQSFFDSVQNDIREGTIGPQESAYALRLTEILENDGGDALYVRSFYATERGRAAHLLGQLGSSEYRDVLLAQAYRDYDPTLAIGILYGLSAFGYDRDGEALEAIRHLIQKAGTRETGVLCASCDALYSIIRYSSGKTALEGTKILLDFMNSSQNEQVQLYARRVLENILL